VGNESAMTVLLN